MATNERLDRADTMYVAVGTATPSANAPVLYGSRPGVMLTDRDSGGSATVKFVGMFNCTVDAHNGTATSAVAAGDILYHDGTATLSKGTAGTRWGYAGGTVGAGGTAGINVIVGY